MNLETLLQTTSLHHLSNEALVAILRKLIATERKATAEIIEFIKEVARRRLYLEYERTSLFAFLTEDLGYSRQSAQTRIDAARLMAEVPELKEDLKAGSLNLTQLGMVAKSVRQKNRETPDAEVQTEEKRSLLSAIKKHDSVASQKIVAKKLNLEIKAQEKKHFQADESLRVTLTLNKKQQEVVNRVKELISHTHPNPSMADLIEVLGLEFIKRKDPLSPKRPRKTKTAPRENSQEALGAHIQESESLASGLTSANDVSPATTSRERKSSGSATSAMEQMISCSATESMGQKVSDSDTSSMERKTSSSDSELENSSKGSGAKPKQRIGSSDSELQTEMGGLKSSFTNRVEPRNLNPETATIQTSHRTRKSSRKWISKPIQRDVHQKDRCCQWRDPKSGKLCGSRFQLQIDHRHPVWAGGGNEPSNLQLLCRVHNVLKYKREIHSS